MNSTKKTEFKNPEETSFSIEGKRDTDSEKKKFTVDSENSRFPYCIVWTTLPLLSQLLPIIGHTGVCDSEGIVHDFAGPYTVNEDDFAFGKPFKYVKLDNKLFSDQEWNEALFRADQKYRGMMHNLCCNNCHSHVACFLNELGYKGKKNWNMINIWWMCLVNSNYIKVHNQHILFGHIHWDLPANSLFVINNKLFKEKLGKIPH